MKNLEQLRKSWQQLSPDISPIGHLLKYSYPNRWVRFHYLPESKRYPDTDEEYNIIIDRSRQLLEFLSSAEDDLYILAPDYVDKEYRSKLNELLSVIAAGAAEFGTVQMDNEVWNILSARLLPEAVFRVVRLVADEELTDVVIANFSAGFLYHPYDGGMDFILKSTASRDRLKDNFFDWYPLDTGGL